ncbi:MAG TPA: hypothetical protein VGH38_20595, partial [Bryobacteraceae bacterium]
MKNSGLFLTFSALGAMVWLTAPVHAQTRYRLAELVGSNNPTEGRCTVSVVVNGAADVEIRDDTATLRNFSGPRPQWQRFECTGPLPRTTSDLGIRAIEGNGRMTLTHDSDNAGVALVRVRGNEDGDQLYTFDVFWKTGQPYASTDADRAMPDEEMMQTCRSAVENRIRTDGYRYVRFGSISVDARGPDDFVTGTAAGSRERETDNFSFSCRINAYDGQVRRL